MLCGLAVVGQLVSQAHCSQWGHVYRPHSPQLLHCSSLESELRPLPLNPGQGAVQMHKDLYIAGVLGSIHAHIFPRVECFVLTSLEEVRQILEPRK